MSVVELEELEYGSARYQEALALRHTVLREPLGLEWTARELEGEERSRHFALLREGQVVACVSMQELAREIVKLRQMAVGEAWRGRGYGRRLVEDMITRYRGEGRALILLHAREAAVGFYEGLGFVRSGARFREVGLPHWRMELPLS